MSRSYLECIDVFHAGTKEIVASHGAPVDRVSANIIMQGKLIEYGLRMTPSGGHERYDYVAINFTTLDRTGSGGNQTYTVFPVAGFAIAQYVGKNELPKTETRRIGDREKSLALPLIATGTQTVPMRELTVTGLRRVASEFERFKEAVLS